MSKASPGLNSFNTGELSPLMDGRTDFAKYASGCKKLQNFLPTVQGPAVRRGGTKFIKEVFNSAYRSWLLRFSFSATESYVLEFGDYSCRLFTDRSYVVPAAYDGATAYTRGQFVTYNGLSYWCIADSTGNLPTNVTYWYAGTTAVPEFITNIPVADLTGNDGEFRLRIAQTGDILYVVDSLGVHRPMKIARYSDTKWTAADLFFESNGVDDWSLVSGPFEDENTDTALTAHCAVVTDSEVGSTVYICSATSGFFTDYDVNTLFELGDKSLNDTPQWEAGVAITAGNVRRFNGVNYKALNNATTGTAPPTHKSGAQYDGNTGVRWQYQDNGYGNARITAVNSLITKTVSGTANAAGLVRITTSAAHGLVTGYNVHISGVTGTTEANGDWWITVIDATHFDLIGSAYASAWISGGTVTVSAGKVATAIVTSRIPDKACGYSNVTHRWSRYAFLQNSSNFPTSVCFFRERLTFTKGQSFYCSVAGDFENFDKRNELGLIVKDRAVIGTVTSSQADSIAWTAPTSGGMLIGTAGAELTLTELTTAEAFGPANAQVIQQSAHGSRGVTPEVVGESVFFVQRAGKKIRQMGIDGNGVFKSTDLNALNNTLLKAGVVDCAWQSEPWQVLWVVTADGGLFALTYNAEQEVVGWSRHVLGGAYGSGSPVVEAVQVIPSPTNDRDDVYLIVKRTINGSTKRYIEVMMPEVQDGDDFDSAFYVDCGLTYDSTPATSIAGLSHLNGQTVAVLADGYVHPNCTVSGGAITLNYAASVVHVGLPYTSVLTTMRIEAGAADGTAQGKTKRINRVVARFNNTLQAKIGSSESNLDEIQFDNPATAWFTGDKAVPFNGGSDSDGYITIVQDKPLPMTVVALFPQVTTQDRG